MSNETVEETLTTEQQEVLKNYPLEVETPPTGETQRLTPLNLQTPSIGRTVIYNTTPEDRDYFLRNKINIVEQLPAVISNVHDDEIVNLKVTVDGFHTGLFRPNTSMATKEGEEGTWEWPKRV